ncbi:hypothetical protein ES705_34399 [subsurface metagenome]
MILNLGQGLQTIEKSEGDLSLSSLTPHDPIYITYDSNFTDYGFLGTGTAEDPYVIEGYNITTTDSKGIYISSTTKYFTVQNCYIDAEEYGIYIRNVADGTATVFNNTCCNNYNRGISLSSSASSTVVNNTCSNNNYGIIFFSSDSSTVANNTFSNCGLVISEYSIDAYLSYTIENNQVNGKKLGFYTNLDSTTINESIYGQLILVDCTNVTVRDQIISNTTIGLFLYSCTYSNIINNTCSNNGKGIWLGSFNRLTLTNNTCNNNTCNNNSYYGIYLDHSGSSNVANNTCNNNNRQGIYLRFSDSSNVVNNTCNNNNRGISLEYSDSSNVVNNTCNNNNNRGISLWYSDFCVVTYNFLQENEGYGVYLIYSDNTTIHHNTFVDNNLGGTSQALDAGVNNTWYDSATLEGNYWSDWSGEGSYSIDGSANSVDLYPFGEPVVVEYPQIVLLALILSIVTLFLTRIISKKVKKE